MPRFNSRLYKYNANDTNYIRILRIIPRFYSRHSHLIWSIRIILYDYSLANQGSREARFLILVFYFLFLLGGFHYFFNGSNPL